MDLERVGTPSSQQFFVPMRELEHSAPEVYQYPAPEVYQQLAPFSAQQPNHDPSHTYSKDPEKPEFVSPSVQHVYPYAAVGEQQRQSYWVSPEFQGVPPQYTSGALTDYPTALEVPPVEHPSRNEEASICGLKRGFFLLLLGLGGLILLGIAIGVGVGVGVGSQSGGSAAKLSTSPSTSNVTSTAPLPTPTTAPAGSSCPGISSTQYTASNGKKFLHLCGLDYSGEDEATDIENVISQNFDECMESCAQLEECTGAGWGAPTDTNKARGTCWMKKSLRKSHEAPSDWNFAVLIDDLATTKNSINRITTLTSASSSRSPTRTSTP